MNKTPNMSLGLLWKLVQMDFANIYPEYNGICGVVHELECWKVISRSEAEILIKDLQANAGRFGGDTAARYFWKAGNPEPRIYFISERLNELKGVNKN